MARLLGICGARSVLSLRTASNVWHLTFGIPSSQVQLRVGAT